MNAYELYKFYRAVKLHFESSKYDYFTYKGNVKIPTSIDNINPREKFALDKIRQLREPKTYITGNLIFNKDKFIGNFTDQYYTQYRKYIVNGKYIFEEEIKNLDQTSFKSNFTVASDEEIPYIVKLYLQEKISLFTCCAINKIFPWAGKIKPDIIWGDCINNICKATGFFKIDSDDFKLVLIKQYKR